MRHDCPGQRRRFVPVPRLTLPVLALGLLLTAVSVPLVDIAEPVAAGNEPAEATLAGPSKGRLQFVPQGADHIPGAPAEPAANPPAPSVGALDLPRRLPRAESASSPPPIERPHGRPAHPTVTLGAPVLRPATCLSAADACTILCRFLL